MKGDKEILGKYAKKGYSLGKANGQLVTVWFKDSIIGALNQEMAMPEALQDICRRHREGLTASRI